MLVKLVWTSQIFLPIWTELTQISFTEEINGYLLYKLSYLQTQIKPAPSVFQPSTQYQKKQEKKKKKLPWISEMLEPIK